MNYFFLFGTYVLLTCWMIGFIIAFRKRLTCMAGMMAAMALGMSVGLGTGTLAGVWLSEYSFQATMISMLIGGLIGVIAGLPISLMAVLDGLLSGLMGGMMGTMLILMVPPSYTNATLQIMAILCCGVLFILFITLQGEINPELLKKKMFFFNNPSYMFIAIVISAFLSYSQPSPVSEYPLNNHASHQAEEATSNSTPENQLVSPNFVKKLHVQADEFSFFTRAIDLKVNESIQIVLENNGKIEHDFQIEGTNIHVHAGPGKVSNNFVSFEKSGEYMAICTLPGHKEAGMSINIQVS